MKPEKLFYTVPYWGCGMDSHRHKTEAIAAKCIADRIKRLGPKAMPVDKAAVIAARKAGATYAEMAKTFNRSDARLRQIVEAAERKERRAAEQAEYDRKLAELPKIGKRWRLDGGRGTGQFFEVTVVSPAGAGKPAYGTAPVDTLWRVPDRSALARAITAARENARRFRQEQPGRECFA